MKTRCLIVDDEPLAIRVIESHLEKMHDISIIAKCNNALKAIQILKEQKVDLIFLDIQMPELTGLEFLQSLQKKPEVIFTTAYRNYAFDAFEFDAIDYLLKPISFDRMVKAINKYYQRSQIEPGVIQPNTESESPAHIFIKKNKTIIRIRLDEIIYIKSFKDYIRIMTDKEQYITKQSIGKIETMLPESQFIRTHNSYIINLKHINTISPANIGIGEDKIPIGRSFKNYVLNKLKYYHNI